MGLIINKADFIGKYAIGKTNFDSIDAYIARYEEPLLIGVLGVELFKLFKADWIANTPTTLTPIYQSIYDVIREDDLDSWVGWDEWIYWPCENNIRQNFGMKSMLVGLVWFEIVREFKIKMTSAGAFINEAEVSVIADNSFMYQRYNEAAQDAQVIRWFIIKNDTDYPTYNGQYKELAHWAL